jgi:DNA-binding transcriptional regulator LsrR (DeoR family)
MIGRDREAEILRLYHAEKWRVGTIATQLDHHHSTVRRVLAQAGLDAGRVSVRPSMSTTMKMEAPGVCSDHVP